MAPRKSPSSYDRPKFPKKPANQRISLTRAVELTQRYRKAAPASEHSGFFFAKGIADLLSQPGVFGMRVYHGLDADATYRIVLVGVDRQGEDIVGTRQIVANAAARSLSTAVLLDGHLPCPPWCPPNSPLN